MNEQEALTQAAAEVSVALRKFGALASTSRLLENRTVLRREIEELKAERASLQREIARLRDRLSSKAISRELRSIYVEDIRKRLDAHGIYEDHSRRIDEQLFFKSFDEIVGMGGSDKERRAAARHNRG